MFYLNISQTIRFDGTVKHCKWKNTQKYQNSFI